MSRQPQYRDQKQEEQEHESEPKPISVIASAISTLLAAHDCVEVLGEGRYRVETLGANTFHIFEQDSNRWVAMVFINPECRDALEAARFFSTAASGGAHAGSPGGQGHDGDA